MPCIVIAGEDASDVPTDMRYDPGGGGLLHMAAVTLCESIDTVIFVSIHSLGPV